LACRLAAGRVSAEDIAQLRALLARHEAQIASDAGRVYYQKEGDLDFHFLIVQLSGNSRLFHLLCEELYHLLRLYRRQTSTEPARPVQAFKEHHQIVEALEQQNGELAQKLMRRHIGSARETLIRQLDETEGSPIQPT